MSVSYTAVVLHKASRDHLMDTFQEVYFSLLRHAGFTTKNAKGSPLAHHMTMNLGACRNKGIVGKEVKLIVSAWAVDDRVCAARVRSHEGAYCDNQTPHITLFVNPKMGGLPKHANQLLHWVPLGYDLQLVGEIEEL